MTRALAAGDRHPKTDPVIRKLIGWLLLALVVSMGVACSGDGGSSPGSTSTAEPTVVTTATVQPSATTEPTPAVVTGARPFPADALQEIQLVFDRTAQIRGLQPKKPVEPFLIGRNAGADYIISTIKDRDRRILSLQQEVYGLLGLIPEDSDILQLQIRLLRQLVLGFYDPDRKQFFNIEDMGVTSAVSRSTAAHEFVHALQDQYYDINARVDANERDWDAMAAFTDVLEGDARLTENQYTTRFFTGADFAEMLRAFSSLPVDRSGIPQVIDRELNTPYTDGLRFVQTVAPRLPKGVDSIFEKLPRSTAEILHPERYLAGKTPRPVELRPLVDTLGGGWRVMGDSTMGEFTLQSFLLLGLGESATREAAAGWAGDHWSLYGRDDGARLWQYTVVFDDTDEARGFWSGLQASLRGRRAANLQVVGDSLTWAFAGRTIRAAVAGDGVTMVVSNRDDVAKSAATALGMP